MRGKDPLPSFQATPRTLCPLKAAEGSWVRARLSEVKEEKMEERRKETALASFSPFPLESCSSLKAQSKFYPFLEAFPGCPDQNQLIWGAGWLSR